MKRQIITATLTVAVFAAGCGGIGDAPDVRGINLADARERLKAENYEATIVEDDVVFGVVLDTSFTVCEQEAPKGRVVPLKVAKHGC
jgi:beta-lactam-binding protein with PASTA domain